MEGLVKRVSHAATTERNREAVRKRRYTIRGEAANYGEMRLMIAVLEEAVGCFQRYLLCTDRKRRRLFREAEFWIMDDHRNAPFTFNHLCEVLGLDPDYLRRGLRRWRDQRLVSAQMQPPSAA